MKLDKSEVLELFADFTMLLAGVGALTGEQQRAACAVLDDKIKREQLSERLEGEED